MCHQLFGEGFLNYFLLIPTVYFSSSAFLRIFSEFWETWSWKFLGENTKERERDRESNLRVNYDTANNTQKKLVSWNRCSLKTSKILEKFIWRSPSLIKQQVESLQVYLKKNFLIGTFQEFCTNQNLTLFKLWKLNNSSFQETHLCACFSIQTLCHRNKRKLNKN